MRQLNYDKLEKEVRAKYKFVKDTNIDILDSYGRTGYTPRTNSIVLFTDTINEANKSGHFKRRFGKQSTNNLIILALLHEICHVKQHNSYSENFLEEEKLKIVDDESHDNSVLEKEADKFAKQEFKRLNLTKLYR